MVGDDFSAAERRQLGFPPPLVLLEAVGEGFVVGTVGGVMRRVHSLQAGQDVAGDDRTHDLRRELVVRVTVDVDVAHAGIELAARYLDRVQAHVRVHVAPGAPGDLGVARRVQQGVQPQVQVHADADQHVGAGQFYHLAGSGLDHVGVLIAPRQVVCRNEVAADLLGDPGQVIGRGDHPDRRVRGLRCKGQEREQRSQRPECTDVHLHVLSSFRLLQVV